MKDVLLLPAQIEAVSTRKDKTVRLTVGTQEMTPAMAGELYRLQNALVFLAIKETEFGEHERAEIDGLESEFVDDTKKKPSARLRAVLYRVWEQDNKGFADFNLFYLHEMERIISHYKAKLP
jgi:hypothetical protein